MTIGEALAAAVVDVPPGEARREIVALLAAAAGRESAWVRAHDDAALEPSAHRRFLDAVARRSAGEPIAYILGRAGFYGREFIVDAHVLVPRPETEHLIDVAIAALSAVAEPEALDVGTGSGAIAVTLAFELPNARIDAVDVSPHALAVARENAERLGVATRVSFFEGDLLAPFDGRLYDAIVANLPYVPTADIAPSPDPVSYEPRLALDGGADGLDAYRRLLDAAPAHLKPGGVLLMEAAPPLMDVLCALARRSFPLGTVTLGRDYGERDRFVKVETPR